jgi:hypothetical protein
MRRHLSAVVAILALGGPPAAAETLRAFAERHGLTSTLRQWWVERLRSGVASARMEAAKVLGAEGALFEADDSLGGAERSELLRLVVAALPPEDPSAARPRLEVARQDLALAAARLDALRADPANEAALREATDALSRVDASLRPIQARLAESGGMRERGSALREPAQLLEAWRWVLEAWIDRRLPGRKRDRRSIDLQLARAMVQLGRLVDTESESPQPSDASQDLLKTELGAEAAVGIAVAQHLAGDPKASDAWLEIVRTRAPDSDAARRVQGWRLALAIDAHDMAAMRAAIERLSAPGLAQSLAIAAAREAARQGGADGPAIIAAALAAMDPASRAEWIEGLESSKGPLRTLAQGLRAADRGVERWQRGDAEGAAGAIELLQRGLAEAGDGAPAPMRGEALRALGWAHRSAGDAASASASFEAAAIACDPMAPECLWLAAFTEPGADEAGRARRLDLLRRQRTRDPAGPWAGRVAAWSSRLDGLGSDALAIALLLDVPSSDPFLADARCEAARRILSSAGSDPSAVVESGRRALRALEPVVHVPAAARWRLIAAVGAQDLVTARQAASALRDEDASDPAVRGSLLRLQAMEGDVAGVRRCLAQMSASEAARNALAASFSLGEVGGAEASLAAIDLALLAAESTDLDATLRSVARDRAARALLRAVDGDVRIPSELAERALRGLAGERPGSRVEELAAAEAALSAGRATDAIDRLQRISASLAQGSEPWTETRWRLYRVLASVDADRARRMLEQHLSLLPDGGPAPWGARLLQAARGGSR